MLYGTVYIMTLGGGSLSPVTHNMSLPRLSVSLKRSETQCQQDDSHWGLNPPHLALLIHLKNSEVTHTHCARLL